MDPNNLFDIGKLNDNELGQLEFIVHSPAWEGLFKPYLKAMIRSIEKMMKDRSEARKSLYNDDFLAGQCTALEGFLAFCDGIIENVNLARMAAVQQLTPDQEYQSLRTLGLIRHSGQATRADELTPAEDF